MSRSTTRSAGGSSTRRLRRRGVSLFALGLAGAIALGGCSAGQIAETSVKVPSIPGADASIGSIAIRNAEVSFPSTGYNWPAGSDVPLQLRLVNDGHSADQLVSASADIASSVVLQVVPAGGQASSTPSPEPSVATGTPTPTISGVASPPPSAGTAPGLVSESPSASPSATDALPLALPAEQVVSLTSDGPQLVLKGISSKIDPSAVVKVTLRFAQAGTVTLEVPFSPPSTPLPRTSESGGSSE